MYAQKEKPAENKTSAVANSVAQRKNDDKPAVGIMNIRSQPDAQMVLQAVNDRAKLNHQKSSLKVGQSKVQRRANVSSSENAKNLSPTILQQPENSSETAQLMGWKAILGIMGLGATIAIGTHQVLTSRNKKTMEDNTTLEGKEDPYGPGSSGTLQIRRYQAFAENEKNPFWHVWLSYRLEDGTVFKVAERGNGKENWMDYPVIASVEISNNQLARLLEKDEDIRDKYQPTLYGPGWNDCHTWLSIVQSFAGIEAPLATPRFDMS